MISIHSNNDWIRPFVPRLFKVREIGSLTDTSSGSIAALALDRTLPETLDRILLVRERYQHTMVYLCEPMAAVAGEPVLASLLREAAPDVMVFSDYLFDHEPANHRQISNWFCEHDNIYASAWGSNILGHLQPDRQHKQFYFDALLGNRRPHRDFVHESWQHSDFRNSILLTYYQQDARRGIYDVPFTATGHDSDPSGTSLMDYTLATPIQEPEQPPRCLETLMIIPVTIYNNAWYSIITEGFTAHIGTRLTEKTAKALVSERVFVYFGAPHDLARMRRLGFRTFDGIIDESYDAVTNDQDRWHAAWQQVEWLCQQDPLVIQAATQDIRSHNRAVFLNTDWHSNLRQHLRDMIAQWKPRT